MESINKNVKLGLPLHRISGPSSALVSNAGSPADSIGGFNFMNGSYLPNDKIDGRISFEKKIELGYYTYKTLINWNKNSKYWIISFFSGPIYSHPDDAESIITPDLYEINPGDVIYSPAYQYVSFSDVITPDLAQNWIRSFEYGTISTPEIVLKNRYSNFDNVENPDQDGVFNLKYENGNISWDIN